jgi:hypothetical protein
MSDYVIWLVNWGYFIALIFFIWTMDLQNIFSKRQFDL